MSLNPKLGHPFRTNTSEVHELPSRTALGIMRVGK